MELDITIVRYQGNSVMSSGDVIGINASGQNRKVRIAFTPTQALRSITFRVAGATKSYADSKVFSYGITTTDSNAPAAPYMATADWYTLPASTTGAIDESVTVEADFAAGTTYYLWLWGAPSGGYAWITYSAITLTASALGLAHIDSGTEIESYGAYIHNGEEYEQYIPYVHNGTDWEVMA
jgi:hypothetical protein